MDDIKKKLYFTPFHFYWNINFDVSLSTVSINTLRFRLSVIVAIWFIFGSIKGLVTYFLCDHMNSFYHLIKQFMVEW